MEIINEQQFNHHKLNTVFHDAGGKKVVVFCHGFRGTSIGPSRHFVDIARQLEPLGISSFRFDQYCSGNSEGNWFASSFIDWVQTTESIVHHFLGQEYQVALFGQSMGAATVICVGSDVPGLTSFVAWVPDASIDPYQPSGTGFAEEDGQRVQDSFWTEAHAMNIPEKLKRCTMPAYIIQCGQDEYVNSKNRKAICDNTQHNHTIDYFENYKHSKWTYDEAQEVIERSITFLIKNFQ